MIDRLQDVLFYLSLPVIAVLVGGIVATLRPPGPTIRSSIQHFAAGVVFAAVAAELLPEMIRERQPQAIFIGAALGVGLMLAVRSLTYKLGQPKSLSEPKKPAGLVATVGVDLVVDGLLVGVGFAAGARQGILIAIALTIEVLFIGLSAANSLVGAGVSRRRTLQVTVGLAALLAGGALVGVLMLGALSGFALELVLSFGAMALLYLVVEELLVEAHEVPETPLITAAFFAGFLLLLLIDILAQGE